MKPTIRPARCRQKYRYQKHRMKHSTAHSHLSIAFPAVHYLGFLTCFIFRPFFFSLKILKLPQFHLFFTSMRKLFFFSSMVFIFYLFLFENLWKKLDFLAGLCKRKGTERKIPAEMIFFLWRFTKKHDSVVQLIASCRGKQIQIIPSICVSSTCTKVWNLIK